jgi:hypothetical protein
MTLHTALLVTLRSRLADANVQQLHGPMVDCYQHDVACPLCELHFMALSSMLQLGVQPCGPIFPVRHDALQHRAQVSRIVGERPRLRGRREGSVLAAPTISVT